MIKYNMIQYNRIYIIYNKTPFKDLGRRCWQEGWEADPRDEALARGLAEIHGLLAALF